MPRKDQIIKELQKNGRRVTQQRRILLDVILNGKWTCCKEIYYEASKLDPSIGMATVYRMVNTLEEMGVLRKSYRYCLPPDHKKGRQIGA